jgi:hypothetical protein
VQSQGVVKSASLNLDAVEQSPCLKDTIVEQLHDVFHVPFHGTLKVDHKQEVIFLYSMYLILAQLHFVLHTLCILHYNHLLGHQPFP